VGSASSSLSDSAAAGADDVDLRGLPGRVLGGYYVYEVSFTEEDMVRS
jgi:hypothetical protein